MKLLLAALLFAPSFLLVAKDSATNKPNILIIYVDDLGYGELGCYGMKEVPTPNIDSIAANGIRFTDGYVSASVCSPSRAGMMTGRYQQRFGHEGNQMFGGGMAKSETTFGQRMKDLGYATAIVGKWHLGDPDAYSPLSRGFDYFYGVLHNPSSYLKPKTFVDSSVSPKSKKLDLKNYYTTEAFGEKASSWIKQQQNSPWFLYLAFNAVHVPLDEAPKKYLDRFEHVSDRNARRFYATLSALDDAVGVVLKELRELKLEENTLVCFISDNGAPVGRGNGGLRGGKLDCWEGGTRVPWIMQWKGTLPAGVVEKRPVIQLDVMPTCVAAAGGTVDPAWKLDGVNLMPYLIGGNDERPHQTLYWRYQEAWAIRDGDMKLVKGEPGAEIELFDLAKDREEQANLASQQPEKFKELKAMWDRWNSELPAYAAPDRKAAKKDE